MRRRWWIGLPLASFGVPAAGLLGGNAGAAARRGRIDPELALADFVIHPDLGFRTTPFPSFFDHARNTGERVAREQLPALLASLQRAGARTQRKPM